MIIYIIYIYIYKCLSLISWQNHWIQLRLQVKQKSPKFWWRLWRSHNIYIYIYVYSLSLSQYMCTCIYDLFVSCFFSKSKACKASMQGWGKKQCHFDKILAWILFKSQKLHLPLMYVYTYIFIFYWALCSSYFII